MGSSFLRAVTVRTDDASSRHTLAPGRVLVTGGFGGVGRYIVDELVRSGYRVGVLDLKEAPALQPNGCVHHKVDVLSLEAVKQAIGSDGGYDAVLHVAGIPHPLDEPAKRVFDVNANGTFNVLQAASCTPSVRKVIFTSSVSTLGFAFAAHRLAPSFIPVDESHPNLPQDPYGLSKVVCEQICRSYSDQFGLHTLCLRLPWVWLPEDGPDERPYYRTLIADSLAAVGGSSDREAWHKELWTYVDARDAARAHRLALETELASTHETFFITGPHNWTRVHDGRALVQQFWPEAAGSIAPSFDGAKDPVRRAGLPPKAGPAIHNTNPYPNPIPAHLPRQSDAAARVRAAPRRRARARRDGRGDIGAAVS